VAVGETARLIASLELKDQFSGTADKALGKMGKLDAAVSRSGGRAYKAGTQIGTGIKNGALIAAGAIGFLATNVALGLRSLEQLETITTQTNAVLTSTQSVAGQTAGSVRNLAEKYEALNATIDDKVIQNAENLLLTFTNIRTKAFEPALQAALNMNQALGGGEEGLAGIVQILGKALNDPIKGMTLLQRKGIVLTAAQKEQIKAAVEVGDTFKAQGIILGELDKRYGTSFLAGGTTTAAKVAKFKDSIEELQKTLASALLPVIGKVADAMSKFLADPAVIKGAKDLGDSIAGLFSDKNLASGADFLKGAFQTAKEAAPVIADAARATFGIVQAAVGLFKSLPPDLQKVAIGAFAVNKLTGGLVTNIGGAIAGGLASFLAKSFTGGMNVNAGVVNVNGVAGGLPGAAGSATKGGGLIATAAKAIIPVAIVGMATEVAFQIAGIGDPGHKGTSGQIVRQNTAPADISKNQAAVLAALRERAAKGDTFAQKQIDAILSLRKALTGGLSVEDRDLVSATRKAGEKATLDARRIEAVENRTGSKVVGNLVKVAATTGHLKAAIDAAKNKISADTRAEGIGIRNSVDRKRWQFTVNNTINTTVNVRETIRARTTLRRLFNSPS
jgi:hypothetical protein